MIRTEKDMAISVKENMRGGNKSVNFLEVVDKQNLLHSRLFSKLTLTPGSSIGPHEHSGEIEYYYILKGEGVVTEKDGQKLVKEGDVVITGWGNSHAISNESDKDLEFLAVIMVE